MSTSVGNYAGRRLCTSFSEHLAQAQGTGFTERYGFQGRTPNDSRYVDSSECPQSRDSSPTARRSGTPFIRQDLPQALATKWTFFANGARIARCLEGKVKTAIKTI